MSYIVDRVVSPNVVLAGNVPTIASTSYVCKAIEPNQIACIEYRADEAPQLHELIAAYRTANGLNNRASHVEPV